MTLDILGPSPVTTKGNRYVLLKHVYEGPKENVLLLLPFGPHLIAVYEDSTLIVWDIKAEEITAEIPFTNISISAIVHPSTYLNKILLGSLQGCLQLWNLRTNKLIYTFDGWGSPVTVLEQAPAINVVAVGLECGDIYIHNLKFDETLMKFSQDWGAVTGLSFRTDQEDPPSDLFQHTAAEGSGTGLHT
ncbi:WD repeat-containing protein 36 [Araneus ventricosus]|uniref:WD repeat-containing protein 36 n=1 Tax=Araneus ventricosus TaxID=182803 RepID=A0A4Y2R7B6_ARAVE|nr:WD repeat-containing protein 36 [Araneus ventricosus]